MKMEILPKKLTLKLELTLKLVIIKHLNIKN